jgi:AcrR family transcriptional regulator
MDANNENPPSEGNRGAKTMEQLLSAGVEAFARFGPEGVTTRQLAKVAGVNIAAIAYYFGGKEGYYIAVVKHLMREQGKPVLSFLSDISEELKCSQRTPEVAGPLLMRLLRGFTFNILINPNAKFISSITTRENLHPTSAYEVIYKETILRMHTILSEVVGCATRTPADAPDTIIRAHAILGQILLFEIAATTICRRLGWDTITKERAEHIAGIVAGMACRAIGIEPIAGDDRKKGAKDEA